MRPSLSSCRAWIFLCFLIFSCLLTHFSSFLPIPGYWWSPEISPLPYLVLSHTSSALLLHFSSSPDAGDYSLPKSICHPDPGITSHPPHQRPSWSCLLAFHRPSLLGNQMQMPVVSSISLSLALPRHQWIYWGLSSPFGLRHLPRLYGVVLAMTRFLHSRDSHPKCGWTSHQRGLAYPLPGTVLTACFPPTLRTAPSHSKLAGLLSF